MLEIKGEQLSDSSFDDLKLVYDILYYDGQLLSLYKLENHLYLVVFVDVDKDFNRWLLIQVTPFLLHQFSIENISLRNIIISNNYAYTFDTNNNLEKKNIKKIDTMDLPEDYLPTIDSFFPFNFNNMNIVQ